MEENKYSAGSEYKKLIIVLLVLGLIGGSFLLYLALPLLSSTETILATRPVDPFDPLRGQYIIINYQIGSVPQIGGAEAGDTIYILLKEDENKTARYVSASVTKPEEGLFIKGKVQYASESSLSVQYGIEQYFFERHAQLPTRNLQVKVKISGSGQARIVELLHDGKPVIIQYENKTLTS